MPAAVVIAICDRLTVLLIEIVTTAVACDREVAAAIVLKMAEDITSTGV